MTISSLPIDLPERQSTYPIRSVNDPFIQRVQNVVGRCFALLQALWDKLFCRKSAPPPPLVLIEELSSLDKGTPPKQLFYEKFISFLKDFQSMVEEDQIPALQTDKHIRHKVCFCLGVPIGKKSVASIQNWIPILIQELEEEPIEERKKPIDKGLSITLADLTSENKNYQQFQAQLYRAVKQDPEYAKEKLTECERLLESCEDPKVRKKCYENFAEVYSKLGLLDEAFEKIEDFDAVSILIITPKAIKHRRMDLAEKAVEAFEKRIPESEYSHFLKRTKNFTLSQLAAAYAEDGNFDKALETYRRIFPRRDGYGGIDEIARLMKRAGENIFDRLYKNEIADLKYRLESEIKRETFAMANRSIIDRGVSDKTVQTLGEAILGKLKEVKQIATFKKIFSHWNGLDEPFKHKLNAFLVIDLLDSHLDRNPKLLEALSRWSAVNEDELLKILLKHVDRYIDEESEKAFVERFLKRYVNFTAKGPLEVLPSVFPLIEKIEDPVWKLRLFDDLRRKLKSGAKR